MPQEKPQKFQKIIHEIILIYYSSFFQMTIVIYENIQRHGLYYLKIVFTFKKKKTIEI